MLYNSQFSSAHAASIMGKTADSTAVRMTIIDLLKQLAVCRVLYGSILTVLCTFYPIMVGDTPEPETSEASYLGQGEQHLDVDLLSDEGTER